MERYLIPYGIEGKWRFKLPFEITAETRVMLVSNCCKKMNARKEYII